MFGRASNATGRGSAMSSLMHSRTHMRSRQGCPRPCRSKTVGPPTLQQRRQLRQGCWIKCVMSGLYNRQCGKSLPTLPSLPQGSDYKGLGPAGLMSSLSDAAVHQLAQCACIFLPSMKHLIMQAAETLQLWPGRMRQQIAQITFSSVPVRAPATTISRTFYVIHRVAKAAASPCAPTL